MLLNAIKMLCNIPDEVLLTAGSADDAASEDGYTEQSEDFADGGGSAVGACDFAA